MMRALSSSVVVPDSEGLVGMQLTAWRRRQIDLAPAAVPDLPSSGVGVVSARSGNSRGSGGRLAAIQLFTWPESFSCGATFVLPEQIPAGVAKIWAAQHPGCLAVGFTIANPLSWRRSQKKTSCRKQVETAAVIAASRPMTRAQVESNSPNSPPWIGEGFHVGHLAFHLGYRLH